jgi:hypothetical protein
MRESAGPSPGTGRPQYFSARNDARLTRATSSRQATSRGQARQPETHSSRTGSSRVLRAARTTPAALRVTG